MEPLSKRLKLVLSDSETDTGSDSSSRSDCNSIGEDDDASTSTGESDEKSPANCPIKLDPDFYLSRDNAISVWDGVWGPWGLIAWALLSKVRTLASVIHYISNPLSMDFVANTLLSVGSSLAMVHFLEDISELGSKGKGLCIDIASISAEWILPVKAAAEAANKMGKPWVLDPIAADASGFRLNAYLDLVRLKPTVIRGNWSHIVWLLKTLEPKPKGEESSYETVDNRKIVKSLAQTTGSIVFMSGGADCISNGNQVAAVWNGVDMMQMINTVEFSVSALIAAFIAVNPSMALEATISAVSIFGVAAEKGKELAKGPASLQMHLIDCLHGLDEDTVLEMVNIGNHHR